MSPSALPQQSQPPSLFPPGGKRRGGAGPSRVEPVGHFVFTGWDLRAHSENEPFLLRPIESVGFCSANALLLLEPWGATTYTKGAGEAVKQRCGKETLTVAAKKVWMIAGRAREREHESRGSNCLAFLIRHAANKAQASTQAINMLMIMNCNWNCVGGQAAGPKAAKYYSLCVAYYAGPKTNSRKREYVRCTLSSF